MNNQKKTIPAATQKSTPKPPRKLVPRPAEKSAEVVGGDEFSDDLVTAGAIVITTGKPLDVAAGAKRRPVRKPSRADETVAKHQKVLADALEKAQAINYDSPQVMKQEAKEHKKPAKQAKVRKHRLVRDSYAMPEAEYRCIGELKKRLAALGTEYKKSEVLRAGVAQLAALNDAELTVVMGRVERIKTGRPVK